MIGRYSFTRSQSITHGVSKRAAAALVLFGLFVAAGAATTSAQLNNRDPRFRIPFAFTANGKTLPAGEYKLSRVEPKVIALQGIEDQGGVLLSTQTDYPAESEISGRTALVFDNYFGREYALSTVRAGDLHFDVVPMHHGEQAARRSGHQVTIDAEQMP